MTTCIGAMLLGLMVRLHRKHRQAGREGHCAGLEKEVSNLTTHWALGYVSLKLTEESEITIKLVAPIISIGVEIILESE